MDGFTGRMSLALKFTRIILAQNRGSELVHYMFSWTNKNRSGNPLSFGHIQVPSHRLQISGLIICLPNVFNQVKMKRFQEICNLRRLQTETPGAF
jgi:hypothetical protein